MNKRVIRCWKLYIRLCKPIASTGDTPKAGLGKPWHGPCQGRREFKGTWRTSQPWTVVNSKGPFWLKHHSQVSKSLSMTHGSAEALRACRKLICWFNRFSTFQHSAQAFLPPLHWPILPPYLSRDWGRDILPFSPHKNWLMFLFTLCQEPVLQQQTCSGFTSHRTPGQEWVRKNPTLAVCIY